MPVSLTVAPLETPHPGFQGSICALITPLLADDRIDFAALARLIEYQIAGGTDALVIAGSTGESVALETEEFEALIAASVKMVINLIFFIIIVSFVFILNFFEIITILHLGQTISACLQDNFPHQHQNLYQPH